MFQSLRRVPITGTFAFIVSAFDTKSNPYAAREMAIERICLVTKSSRRLRNIPYVKMADVNTDALKSYLFVSDAKV